jgi:hypothetical protein
VILITLGLIVHWAGLGNGVALAVAAAMNNNINELVRICRFIFLCSYFLFLPPGIDAITGGKNRHKNAP